MVNIMKPIDFLKQYRNNLDYYYPMIDHQYKIFPYKSEYGEINIGWSCGLIDEKKPYFLECWAENNIAMLTVFVSNIGIEKTTVEELDNPLQNCNVYKKKHCAHETTMLVIEDTNNNKFFALNVVVRIEDDTFIENDSAIIYPFSKLNVLNSNLRNEL